MGWVYWEINLISVSQERPGALAPSNTSTAQRFSSLRRCRDLLAVSSTGAAGFPRQVKGLLQRALRLRDRHAQGEMGGGGLAVATGRLEARMEELLSRTFRTGPNLRLAKHLRHE